MKPFIMRFIITAALFLALPCATLRAATTPKFVPREGKILVFAGQDTGSIPRYVKAIGIEPSGVMFYTSVQEAGGLDEAVDYGAGEGHAALLLKKYPFAALNIGLYMVDALESVAAGDYDDNIDKIGEFIKRSGRPSYLRVGYEFDGPHNHYDPAFFVKAYRYIADRLRKNGVDNVAYVWHSYAAYPRVDHMRWYPGDDYVDWIGISYFGQSSSEMMQVVALAAKLSKPVMIAESTPAGIGTSGGMKAWYRWFAPYFSFIEKNNIKALSYINCDWDALPMFVDLNWKDCRLESNAEVTEKWKAEISKEKYLKGSVELFGLLGFKK